MSRYRGMSSRRSSKRLAPAVHYPLSSDFGKRGNRPRPAPRFPPPGGRMKVANSGGSASGFALDATYTVDAGADVPASATRSLANHQASGYDFSLTSRKDGESGQWQNTAGSRSTWNSSSDSSSFIASGFWGSHSPAFSISGTFTSEQSESSSQSSSSDSDLDPQSGDWSNDTSYSFTHEVRNIRHSVGSGSYSHNQYGFEVSGTISVADEFSSISYHSLTNILNDGVRSPESSGSRYTELDTRWMVSTSGGGSSVGTTVNTNPLNNHLGQAIGTVTTTTSLDHLASEDSLRDFQTSDRTDWRYDLGSGTLIPTERVQIDHHVIDTTMVRRFDTTVQTETESSRTVDGRNQTYENSLWGRNRETVQSGRNSIRTAISTTPLEGAAIGVATLVVSGTSDVSYRNIQTLQRAGRWVPAASRHRKTRPRSMTCGIKSPMTRRWRTGI